MSLRLFLADQKIAISWEGAGGGGGGGNAFWGILQHAQQVTACCHTHSDYGPPKIPLKLAV